MKLQNKRTGERGIINYFDNQSIVIYPIDENWNAKGDKKYVYHSLAELNEEWGDYYKEYWHIPWCGDVVKETDDNTRFLAYLLRWQLSSPILALCMWLMGGWNIVLATIIANLVGACIFYFVDKRIFRGKDEK